MATLKVSVLLLVLVAQCWTTPLEVLVDGMEFTGTGFCVGDNVTFVCDLPSNDHVWYIAGEPISIVRGYPSTLTGGPARRFSLAVARPLPIDSTITTLSVIAYSGFNGVNISCFTRNGVIVEPQNSTATLLGPPSAPVISLIANADFQSFNVNLTSAGSSSRCVLQYSLTIIEIVGPLRTITIGSNGTGIVRGLNLCKNTYIFSAVAVTEDMNSSSSGAVAGQVDFSVVSKLSRVNADDGGVVQWTISRGLPGECYGSYSMRLSRCTIYEFAILPAVNLNDYAVRAIFAGISASTSPIGMATVYSASYASVDIGNCDIPTLRTTITPANISGLLLLSSATTVASTSLCNISLKSEGVASTSFLVTGCGATVHTPSEHVTVNDVTVNDVTTTIAPTDNGDGCSGVERSSGVVLGGVVGGIGVGIFQTLVVIVVVVVILLIKKASKPEIKGQRSQHESPAIQLNNPARSPGDSTNLSHLYEEYISTYENPDVIMQQKAPEDANVGPSGGDYVFSQCNAYGVHKKPEEMMEGRCYAQLEAPGGGH